MCCRRLWRYVAWRRRVQGFVVGIRSAFVRRQLGGHCIFGPRRSSRQRLNWSTRTRRCTRQRTLRPSALSLRLTLPNCGRRECQTCPYIKELNDNQVVTAVMRRKCDANPWRIEMPLDDNNTGFQNLCKHVLRCRGLSAILTSLRFLPTMLVTMGHSISASNRRMYTSNFMSWYYSQVPQGLQL